MSDRSPFLSGLVKDLKKGLQNVNEEAKQRAARSKGTATNAAEHEAEVTQQPAETADIDDLIVEEVADGAHQNFNSAAHDENIVDIDDGLIIDAEPIAPAKPAKKGIDKKKLLAIVGLAVAGIVFLTQNDDKLTPDQLISQTAPLTASDDASDGSNDLISFDMLGGSSDEQDADEVDMLGFNSGSSDSANDPIVFDPTATESNTAFETQAASILDPFTGIVSEEPASPFDLKEDAANNDVFGADVGGEQVFEAETVVETQPTQPVAGENDPFSITAVASEVDAGVSNDTGSSGSNQALPDITSTALLDQTANADVANLKSELEKKDGRISLLKTELETTKAELAKANKAAVEAKRQVAAKAATPAQAPKQAAPAPVQRVAQQQRVVPAPKAPARPQICVSAIAQAARNCTTCVPHAFIRHKGADTIVGKGDFVEGLRVNIVGDRLDLQDSDGRVVHKFWSSSNGCPTS